MDILITTIKIVKVFVEWGEIMIKPTVLALVIMLCIINFTNVHKRINKFFKI